MIIRPEVPEDVDQIASLTLAAFATVPYGDGTEAAIIAGLRAAGDLTLSLVACTEDIVLGQVSVSPACVGEANNWFGIGPIAVHPDYHGQGIGSALMEAAITKMQAQGAAGLVLTGNPAYYNRFGFAGQAALTYLEVSPRNVMRRVLNGPDADGEITFAPALQGS